MHVCRHDHVGAQAREAPSSRRIKREQDRIAFDRANRQGAGIEMRGGEEHAAGDAEPPEARHRGNVTRQTSAERSTPPGSTCSSRARREVCGDTRGCRSHRRAGILPALLPCLHKILTSRRTNRAGDVSYSGPRTTDHGSPPPSPVVQLEHAPRFQFAPAAGRP